ncbi:MAG: cysteine desulfurase [Candidatus Methanophagaceae archaeon]|nr:MAG: cysteine desulfurase [Methanophagales archaeon]
MTDIDIDIDTERIRQDFTILESGIIYMDTAATSLTPEPVLDAVLDYYRRYNANVGRGVHRLTRIATAEYEEARNKVAKFIGARAHEIVFTRNTTEGINMVASGLSMHKGDKVVISLLEHHSNLLPWLRAKRKFGMDIDIEVVKPANGDRKSCELDISDFEAAIDADTRIVAVSHVSNALGSILPIRAISKLCHANDALLLVDGAQSVPHLPVDVKELGCDFMAFSGHKMLAPTGIGALYIREELMPEIEPLNVGGGGVETASFVDYKLKGANEGFESGTPDISGAIGLGAAVDYLNAIGMENVKRKEEKLTKELIEGLQEIPGVELYGYDYDASSNKRIGTVSFNIDGKNPDDVALMLDNKAGIIVRSGHHCCMPLMNYLGIEGTVRASLYLYNTESEVNRLLELVRTIAASGR